MQRVTERQATLMSRQIEGVMEQFLVSVGITDKAVQGYAKEAVLLNTLANILIYRTLLERDAGEIRKEDVNERVNQRVRHIQETLPECVQFQADLHAKASKAPKDKQDG